MEEELEEEDEDEEGEEGQDEEEEIEKEDIKEEEWYQGYDDSDIKIDEERKKSMSSSTMMK